ncbi:uncharacterized protein MKZ38_002157 [Zalerion maritima]|uniref:Transcription factor domain-containing protein n=1 Tax=Zalerion maritima TaxID=339359 RepID=A0AAD5WR16_9PEZI|nr:uncharacterized protein MKZ38_002157 [Zalerion maritima]
MSPCAMQAAQVEIEMDVHHRHIRQDFIHRRTAEHVQTALGQRQNAFFETTKEALEVAKGSSAATAATSQLQLEKKIDSIFAMLHKQSEQTSVSTTANENPPAPPIRPTPANYQTPPGLPSSDHVGGGIGQASDATAATSPSGTRTNTTTTAASATAVPNAAPTSGRIGSGHCLISSYSIPLVTANARLSTFRGEMLHYLPFVYIPTSTSAALLRESRPFLWFVIMTLTCPEYTQQLRMSEDTERYLAEHIVVRHERNIDLLLGTLCYVGWGHYHKQDRPYLVVAMSLAHTLVYDLGLHKANNHGSQVTSTVNCWKQYDIPMPPIVLGQKSNPMELTMEERRALLACYYVSNTHNRNSVTMALKRNESISWTSNMEYSLKVLIDEAEHPGDHVLAAMVKIQCIADQVSKSGSWQILGVGANASSSVRGADSAAFFYSAMRAKLNDVKNDISEESLRHPSIAGSLLLTDIFIHEVTLAQTAPPPAPQPSSCHPLSQPISSFHTAQTQSNPPASQPQARPPLSLSHQPPDLSIFRLTTLSNSLTVVLEWIDSFFFPTIQPSSYLYLPLGIWLEMAHVLAFVFRNAMDASFGSGNKEAVRTRVDLLGTCDRLMERVERAEREAVQRWEEGDEDGLGGTGDEHGTAGDAGGGDGYASASGNGHGRGRGERKGSSAAQALFSKTARLVRAIRIGWAMEIEPKDTTTGQTMTAMMTGQQQMGMGMTQGMSVGGPGDLGDINPSGVVNGLTGGRAGGIGGAGQSQQAPEIPANMQWNNANQQGMAMMPSLFEDGWLSDLVFNTSWQ